MQTIARIVTKSGKVAAEIKQTPRGSLCWSGAWGAGCGADTWQSVRSHMVHRRGWQIVQDHQLLH